jgi:predicted GNAT superfamily acetyltransferase
LKTLQPYYYDEIKQEISNGLLADRLVVLKIQHSKQLIQPDQPQHAVVKKVSHNLFREVIKYL